MAPKQGGNQGNKGGSKSGSQDDDNKGSPSSGRGFASMDKDRQRDIASEGGRAALESGNANQAMSDEKSMTVQSRGGQSGSSGSSSGGSSRGGKK
jgi:hypothetical protein